MQKRVQSKHEIGVATQTKWSHNANTLESNTNELESKCKQIGVKMRNWSQIPSLQVKMQASWSQKEIDLESKCQHFTLITE
eukprot:4036499-Amphidinium_carterae.1